MKKFKTQIADWIVAIVKRNPLIIHMHEKNCKRSIRKLYEIIYFPLSLLYYIFVQFGGMVHKYINYIYKVSIVAIIKNEADYLDEWINYHKLIGVDHFYIFNNESTDNTKKILQKYVKEGTVTLINFPGKERQHDAYNYALNAWRNESEYMAFIDADEFLFLDDTYNNLYSCISFLLKKYSADVLAVNWCIFGSSHKKEKPEGLVIENYIWRSNKDNEYNKHIKTICNPRRVIGFRSSHYVTGFTKKYVVGTNGKQVSGALSNEICFDYLRVNHYFTKSFAEFEKKRKRGMADQPGIRDDSNFKAYDFNDVYDDSMKKFVKYLSK